MAAHVPAAKVGVSLFPIDAAMRASCGGSALESAPAKREGAWRTLAPAWLGQRRAGCSVESDGCWLANWSGLRSSCSD